MLCISGIFNSLIISLELDLMMKGVLQDIAASKRPPLENLSNEQFFLVLYYHLTRYCSISALNNKDGRTLSFLCLMKSYTSRLDVLWLTRYWFIGLIVSIQSGLSCNTRNVPLSGFKLGWSFQIKKRLQLLVFQGNIHWSNQC